MSQLAADDALGYARSLLQARLLSEVFADRVQSFVLKGGMAMRVRHDHARSTQDIDLDSDASIPLSTMQGLVRRAIRRALSFGILENAEITEPKQTETTARWRIRGFDPASRQNLLLTIEVSRRDHIDASDFDVVQYAPSASQYERPICVYNNRALAFKKIKALLADSREAPRDVSDLFLLIRAEVDPPIAELSQWLEGQDVQAVIKRLWHKIESMDEERFKAEVLPSLPITHQAQDLYRSWEQIRLEVGVHVERWLEQAAAQKSNQEVLETASPGSSSLRSFRSIQASSAGASCKVHR